MSFRIRLFLAFAIVVGLSVGTVSWRVSTNMRTRFAQLEEQRTQALLAQFRGEFSSRCSDVERRLEQIARKEPISRLIVDLNRTDMDFSSWVNEATGLAQAHDLDFLELVAGDGAIISSAQWPARFGYIEDLILKWNVQPGAHAFLEPIELPEEVVLGIIAIRAVQAGNNRLYVIGGLRLDRSVLSTIALPEGMRVLLYRNAGGAFSSELLTGTKGPVAQAKALAPLILEVQQKNQELRRSVDWSADPSESETVQAIPLMGRDRQLLGILFVANSRKDLVRLATYIRSRAVLVGAFGIGLGLLVAWWASARVTRPVKLLVQGAREVAAGNWNAQVNVTRNDEIGRLAATFNKMTQQLVDQRERLLQAERVAAWRELARRLAHELKNPLFPLQITVENLKRAKEQYPEQFDEVFLESTGTLLAELGNLRTIIQRFSDFAKMPAPQLEMVNLNQIVGRAIRLFEAQIQSRTQNPIHLETELATDLKDLLADPEQLTRALQNLILNAMDAMPEGGNLTVRTRWHDNAAHLEIADTGVGLTLEECERLFTPYYTTKQHGTGLGLAIVQSVVSDHGGKISVKSAPGQGTTFRIEFPLRT